jgi:hypothetical protein
MASCKFTHRTIAAAVCPPGRKDILIFDTETRGFGVRVTAAGSKRLGVVAGDGER